MSLNCLASFSSVTNFQSDIFDREPRTDRGLKTWFLVAVGVDVVVVVVVVGDRQSSIL